MTLNEFKAFLEGMAIAECPTPEQWKRIAEKLEMVMPDEKYLPAPFQPLMPAPLPWPRRDESPTVAPPMWKWPTIICGPSNSYGHQQ